MWLYFPNSMNQLQRKMEERRLRLQEEANRYSTWLGVGVALIIVLSIKLAFMQCIVFVGRGL